MQVLMTDVRGLAELLGNVSLRKIEQMLAAGELPPPIRFGRVRRWLIEDVHGWLRARSPQSSTPIGPASTELCRPTAGRPRTPRHTQLK